MSNLTPVEISLIYLLISYILGFIMIIITYFAPKKLSDIVFYIWFGVALPIALPITVWLIILKLKENKK